MTERYLSRIGGLIRDARRHKDHRRARRTPGTSKSDVAGSSRGSEPLLEMVARTAEGDSRSYRFSGARELRIEGGVKLSGEIDVRTSRTRGRALCASMLKGPDDAAQTWPGPRRSPDHRGADSIG